MQQETGCCHGQRLAPPFGAAARKQLAAAKKCRHCQRRVQISNPVAANKTEESSQSPWVQSDGIKECVIEEVVDITVTGELKEALECLLELLEELCIRRVQHEDFSASLFLPRFPLLV